MGVIESTLVGHNVDYELIHPQTWIKRVQSYDRIRVEGKTTKDRALFVAKQIFKNYDFTEKLHDGIVDALLIAEYGRRIIYGSDS